MNYRAEIDGLRAVAVIPVVFFHAGFESFGGGFVGVDVFFVISGYLITTIILREMETGTFSIVRFYERRARRILPALFFVILLSLPFAWLWLLPEDLRDFSQSLIAVSTFSSNILFWHETGYWGPANELKPLLHTWSLAVEEQYYVLFPIFLLLLWSWRKRWLLSLLVLIAIVSFALAQWGAVSYPTANFFLLPTRGWELAIGAITAFFMLGSKHREYRLLSSGLLKEILSLLGLSLIIYSVFMFDENTPFPGLFALIPTIGTALIIATSSSGNLVGKLLQLKPLVAVGLISYSAYLWHQPLFAFSRHRSLATPEPVNLMWLIATTFVLALLTWKFVENPFRNKNKFSQLQIFVLAALGSLLIITIGAAGHLTGGFENRSAGITPIAEIDQKRQINYGLHESCSATTTLSSECQTSDEPEILVWGDSYAMHLVPAVLSSNPDAAFRQMTRSLCGPFIDIAPIVANFSSERCLSFNQDVIEWIKQTNTVQYAVLSSPFAQYFQQGASILTREGTIEEATLERIDFEFRKTLGTLEDLGIQVTVVSPPPRNGSIDIGRCLVRAEFFNENLDHCNFYPNDNPEEITKVFAWLKKISNTYSVVFLDDYICTDLRCNAHIDGVFLYRDEGHLSLEGSTLLGERNNFYSIINGSE